MKNQRDAEAVRSSGADGAIELLRRTLYGGPVYRKLYELRQRRPELCYELDDLASSLREMGDRLEELVRAQVEGVTTEPAPTRGSHRPGHPAL